MNDKISTVQEAQFATRVESWLKALTAINAMPVLIARDMVRERRKR